MKKSPGQRREPNASGSVSRRIKAIVALAAVALTVLMLICSTVATPPPASAEEQIRIVDASGNEIMNNPPPIIVADRTMVPLFAIADTLRAKLTWDGDLNTAMLTRGQDLIVFRVGSDQAGKNGQALPLGVPVRIASDRVYVPLKVIADALGLKVSWDGATRTVQLAPSPEKP